MAERAERIYGWQVRNLSAALLKTTGWGAGPWRHSEEFGWQGPRPWSCSGLHRGRRTARSGSGWRGALQAKARMPAQRASLVERDQLPNGPSVNQTPLPTSIRHVQHVLAGAHDLSGKRRSTRQHHHDPAPLVTPARQQLVL